MSLSARLLAGATLKRLTKGLRRLAEQSGDGFKAGIVFYSGNSLIQLGEGPFYAVPISKLWEL